MTACYAGLAHLDHTFADLMHYVRLIGGDTDTIGAMAGALWGASHTRESCPPIVERLEQYAHLVQLAEQLAQVKG